MIYISEEATRDQQIIEKFQRPFDQPRKQMDGKIEKYQEEIRRLMDDHCDIRDRQQHKLQWNTCTFHIMDAFVNL